MHASSRRNDVTRLTRGEDHLKLLIVEVLAFAGTMPRLRGQAGVVARGLGSVYCRPCGARPGGLCGCSREGRRFQSPLGKAAPRVVLPTWGDRPLRTLPAGVDKSRRARARDTTAQTMMMRTAKPTSLSMTENTAPAPRSVRTKNGLMRSVKLPLSCVHAPQCDVTITFLCRWSRPKIGRRCHRHGSLLR